MKKIFIPILVLFICSNAFGQTIRASIGAGTQNNRAIVYVKPDVTQVASNISTLQFNVAVDATGLVNAPTLNVVSVGAGFGAPANWLHDIPPYLEGGYWNYNLFTNLSPLTPALTANTEIPALEVEFTNGSPNMAKVALTTLPDGGSFPSYALFYCTGTVNSNGLSDLYYARTGTTVDNQNSYDPTGGTAGTATSTAIITSSLTIVPVRFVSFDVIKKQDNALLSWAVENESSLADRYEIERSLKGNNFSVIGTVSAINNGIPNKTYTSTDIKLSSLNSTGKIYYRIRQVDRDGKSAYTDIKSVRLDGKTFDVSVYPNPIVANSTVYIDLANAAKVSIKLIDAAGKTIQATTLDGIKGLNTWPLSMNKLATGTYGVQVQAGEESKTISVVKSK